MSRRLALLVALWFLLAAGACSSGNDLPQGLREADEGPGPTVVFDLEAWPFPDIPFPNDLATRYDASSPTERRLNVSELGATEAETEVRRAINRQSGFGTFQPVSVAFDRPLDVQNIVDRHQEPVPNFADDAVYLVNVDPDSDNFGEFRLLDLGRGNFPVTHAEGDRFFANDPRSGGTNLLFETIREEDRNQNGRLDPMEDTDDDGVWDRPNTLHAGGHPLEAGQLLEFYERETNTLLLRPVRPLEPATTYAVVLTRALRGARNEPVRSPFAGVNHARQTAALTPLRDILPHKFPHRFDADLEDVQFAWTFTTGTPTRTLQQLRAGLYGHGPFAELADEYPAELKLLHNATGPDDETPLTLELEEIIDLLVPLVADQVSQATAEVVKDELAEIDYLVSGSFISPYFLADTDGLADSEADATLDGTNPQDDDERLRVNPTTGEATHRPGEVTFNCTVPKTGAGRRAPFPVVIYSHAISSTRLEFLLVAGAFARVGLAVCAIDAAGHGIALPEEFQNIDGLVETIGYPNLPGVIRHHRARDLTNDGEANSGQDYFTSNMLKSRSMIQQTTVDQMQLIRILRSFDGEGSWPEAPSDEEIAQDKWLNARKSILGGWDADGDGKSEVRGDFNGDGTVDFGGNRSYAAFGTSLGAIQTGVLAGIEPTVTAASTNAGGGGLADIASRTTIGHVRVGVLLRMFGPVLVGNRVNDPDSGEPTGRMRLTWLLPSGIDRKRVPFGTIEGVEDGDVITLENLVRSQRNVVPEEERVMAVRVRDGKFRIGIAADAASPMTKQGWLGFDPTEDVVEAVFDCDKDQSRRACLANFDQSTLDAADAETYGRHVIENPRIYGDALVLEHRKPDGTVEQRLDTFPQTTVFQNVVYPEGAPLAALTTGWGLKRQTPRFRRFIGLAQMLLEPADPAIFATHYQQDPLEFPYEDPQFRDGTTDALIVGTVGDQTVPINTGLAHARAAGLINTRGYSSAHDRTHNQFLVDSFVYEGISWLDRFPSHPDTLFDADDLDRGAFRTPDAVHPLRATVETDSGISALRLPYLNPQGAHTFNVPQPDRPFDVPSFMTNQVAWYLAHEGDRLSDDPCLQKMPLDASCEFFDPETYEGPTLGAN